MKIFKVILRDELKQRYHKDYEEIPYEFMEQYEEQANRNYHQSIEKINERGGMSYQEIVACINSKDFNFYNNFKELRLKLIVLSEIVNWSRSKKK